MVKVKVCGITNLVDAELACELGANALGFIFYKKSPRYITPNQVQEIVRNLSRKVCLVGVFVNENIDTVISIAKECGLNIAQLHGDESPKDCQKCLDAGLKVIRGIRVRADSKADELLLWPATAFLLDAFSENAYGGTGKLTDWDFAKEAAKQHKVFLSGGLNPQNVREAIEQVNPHAVDVCSGVESSPGKKDPAKMKQFFEEISRLKNE
jgi:phosphoribosylanthranilate isomerase